MKDNQLITVKEFNEFLSAKSYEEKWKILLEHAEKNNKIVQIRRLNTMEQNNNHFNEEIRKQFEEFCHTKGIAAKFKVAFTNMKENTQKQKEISQKEFSEVKKQSVENNKEFSEFLKTKGLKAKVKLVIENIKKSAKEAPKKAAMSADIISAQTKANIAKVNKSYSNRPNHEIDDNTIYSINQLSFEFNEFLKAKGLDDKYIVEVTEQ